MSDKTKERKLNPNQEKFCQIYVAKGNATRAYIGAGYKARGNSAEALACKLLSNDKVAARIRELHKEMENAFEITRLDMLHYFYDLMKSPAEETRDQIAAAKEVNRMMGFYEPEKKEVSLDGDMVEFFKHLTGATS